MKPLYKLKPLPESLGEAFLVAVNEADWLYRNCRSTYYPHSNRWHIADKREDDNIGICEICIAGALISNSGVDSLEDAGPHYGGNKTGEPFQFDLHDRDRLIAIDNVRTGDFNSAIKLWYSHTIEYFADRQLEDLDKANC